MEEFDFDAELVFKKIDENDVCHLDRTNLNEDFQDRLRCNYKYIEKVYFDLYVKSKQLVLNPSDHNGVTLLCSALSDYINLLSNEEELADIVSYLKSISVFAKESRLSYLLTNEDQDIEDIFLFLLETISNWNYSIGKEFEYFSKSTIDLESALKYFIKIYFEHYRDFKCKESIEEIEQEIKDEESTVEEETDEPVNLMSAQQYFIDIDFDNSILDELEELYSELENYLMSDDLDKEMIDALAKFLDGYIKMLNMLYEFQELAYALDLFKEQLFTIDLSLDNSMVVILLRAIVRDIEEWQRSVFKEQDAEDIHYIDKSFYANIAQIDMILKPSEDDMEGEIDFF